MILFSNVEQFQENEQEEEIDESIKQRRFTYTEKRKEIGRIFVILFLILAADTEMYQFIKIEYTTVHMLINI